MQISWLILNLREKDSYLYGDPISSKSYDYSVNPTIRYFLYQYELPMIYLILWFKQFFKTEPTIEEWLNLFVSSVFFKLLVTKETI